jgi:hypothetical protein
MNNIQTKTYVGSMPVRDNKLGVFNLNISRAGAGQPMSCSGQLYVVSAVNKDIGNGVTVPQITVDQDYDFNSNGLYNHLSRAGIIPTKFIPITIRDPRSQSTPIAEMLANDRKLSDIVWGVADADVIDAFIAGETTRIGAGESSIQAKTAVKKFDIGDDRSEVYFLNMFRADSDAPVTLFTYDHILGVRRGKIHDTDEIASLVSVCGTEFDQNTALAYMHSHGVLGEMDLEAQFLTPGDEYGMDRILSSGLSSILWAGDGDVMNDAIFKGHIDRLVTSFREDADKITDQPQDSDMSSEQCTDKGVYLGSLMKAVGYTPILQAEFVALSQKLSARGGWWDEAD